jgi:hypothetical protein
MPSRRHQSAIVTTTTAAATPSTASSCGGPISQRPRRPEAISHGPLIRAVKPSSVPPAFAFSDESTLPRIRWDQLVVMPQLGHRIWNTYRIVQGQAQLLMRPQPQRAGPQPRGNPQQRHQEAPGHEQRGPLVPPQHPGVL